MEKKIYPWKGGVMSEEPYLIETNEELEELADYVNTGGTCEGFSFCLGADLNWNNRKWTVIGSYNNQFAGTFDGNNHEISGVSLPSGKAECGFFGCLDAGAIVKNLNIKAEATVSMSQNSSIGFLAGINYGIVENCHISGTLTVTQDFGTDLFAGLLVGRNQGSAQISNCSADGYVNEKEGNGGDIICGLAGQNAIGAIIKECVIKGNVTGCSSMAGICKKNVGELNKCQNLAHMKMDVHKLPANLYVFSPGYKTGDGVSGGIYEVSVGEKIKTTLALGKESGVKASVDIIVTPETPLHIGMDDVVSYRKVTLLNGGYIIIEGSASLDIAELYKAVSKQEREQESEMEVIPHWDPSVAFNQGKKDIIVHSQEASANVTIAIGCLYSDLVVEDEEHSIRCIAGAGNVKGNNIVEIEVAQK